MKSLENEITNARREIKADSYQMSIGELTNLYKDNELIIAPEYQRLFIWSGDQKSKLIESILIGIPLPSFFVAQDDDGNWEVIDGLQRISTFLQLQGILRDESDSSKTLPALVLSGTHHLKALEGLVWSEKVDTGDAENEVKGYLTPAQQKDIKRAKLDIKIIQRDSDPKVKYDLFMRLNKDGTQLEAQEVRAAALFQASPEFAKWLIKMANNEIFLNTVNVSQEKISRKYNEELVLRFFLLSSLDDGEIKTFKHLNDALDEYALNLAMEFSDKKEELERVFNTTFSELSKFKDTMFRYYEEEERYRKKFTLSAFEAIATGVGYMILNNIPYRKDLDVASQELWGMENMEATGRSSESRIRKTVRAGREILRKF